ncbi:unnamed protein product [Moneuplotes crassus]|uniref:TRP C-terminal domain-containing protein n=1 Tax=Euplotes crassus TaxID=5936 RepID=A0AAD1XZH0_EUPCR|nr:unnamed protein product [Moneuplotes crassus]
MISKLITIFSLVTILPHTTPQKCTYSDAEWYSVPSNFVYSLQPSNANCQVYSVKVDTAGGWIYSLIKTEFSSAASVVLRKTDYYFRESWRVAYSLDPVKGTLLLSSDLTYLYFINTDLKLTKVKANSGEILGIYDESSITIDATLTSADISSDGKYVHFTANTPNGPGICSFATESIIIGCFGLSSHDFPVSLIAIGQKDIFSIYQANSGSNDLKLSRFTVNDYRRNLELDEASMLEGSRRSLITLTEGWVRGFSPVNGGTAGKSSIVYGSDSGLLYTSLAFDTVTLFLILKASNGAPVVNKYVTNFAEVCTSVDSSLKFNNQIIFITTCSGNSYIYTYEIISDTFSSSLLMSENTYTINVLYTDTFIIYMAGKIAVDGNDECVNSRLMTLTDHKDISDTSNTFRVMSQGEYSAESRNTSGTFATGTITQGVTYTTISNFTLEVNKSASYFTDIAVYTESYKNHTLPERTQMDVEANITCSISGNTTVKRTLKAIDDETSMPDFIKVPTYFSGLSMRTPNIEKIENYSLTVEVSTAGMSINKNVYLWVHPENQPSSIVQISIYASIFITIVYMIITPLLQYHKIGSMSAIFSLCNLFQILCILLCLGERFSESITWYIRGLSPAMFSFRFYFNQDSLLNKIFNPHSHFKCEQTENRLYDIGVHNCSILLNVLPLMAALCTLVFSNILVYVLCYFLKECDGPKYPDGKISKLFGKLKKLCYYDLYVILFYQAIAYLLLASVSEISQGVKDGTGKLLSFILSIGILIFCIGFGIFTAIFNTFKTISTYFHFKRASLGFLGKGFRISKYARLFHSFGLLRKLLLAVIILTISSSKMGLKAGLIMALNVVFLVYLIAIRPFKRVKENLVEIICEILISLFSFMIILHHTEEDWSEVSTTLMLSMFILIISIVLILQLLFLIKHKTQRVPVKKWFLRVSPKKRPQSSVRQNSQLNSAIGFN